MGKVAIVTSEWYEGAFVITDDNDYKALSDWLGANDAHLSPIEQELTRELADSLDGYFTQDQPEEYSSVEEFLAANEVHIRIVDVHYFGGPSAEAFDGAADRLGWDEVASRVASAARAAGIVVPGFFYSPALADAVEAVTGERIRVEEW